MRNLIIDLAYTISSAVAVLTRFAYRASSSFIDDMPHNVAAFFSGNKVSESIFGFQKYISMTKIWVQFLKMGDRIQILVTWTPPIPITNIDVARKLTVIIECFVCCRNKI